LMWVSLSEMKKVNLPPWDANLPLSCSIINDVSLVVYTNSTEVYPCGSGRQLYPEAIISP
jgi:hypothetical protein